MVTKQPFPPDVLNPNCGTRQVLDVVADRWTVIVIHVLSRGTMRFGELRRTIGISQKVLTDTLRRLERDGIVQRKVYPVVPPKVEYSLTDLGSSLTELLSSLCRWAEQHLDEVEAARDRFR
jgi:DNA-binding HxlR family transcriptional regulator